MEEKPNKHQSKKDEPVERLEKTDGDKLEHQPQHSPLNQSTSSSTEKLEISDDDQEVIDHDSIETSELSKEEIANEGLSVDPTATTQLPIINELEVTDETLDPTKQEKMTNRPYKIQVDQIAEKENMDEAGKSKLVQRTSSSAEINVELSEHNKEEKLEFDGKSSGDLEKTIPYTKDDLQQKTEQKPANPITTQQISRNNRTKQAEVQQPQLPIKESHFPKKRFLWGLLSFLLLGGALAIIFGPDLFARETNPNQQKQTAVKQDDHLTLTFQGKTFDYDLQKAGYDGKNLQSINQSALRTWLDQVKKQVDHPPVNASAKRLHAEIKPEASGWYMDTEKVESWLENLKPYINHSTEIPIMKVEPTVTIQDIEQVDKKKVGSYTTKYDGNNANRMNNIRLASKAIDGIILLPGEKFSFNKVVGERTEARGYKTAGVIVKGEFSEGIGGGICQVSSTLFNSVDQAGLKIVRRFSHSATVTYVPPGRDATVSWDGPDFKFKNNFNKPIMIRIRVGPNSMTVDTYTAPGAKVRQKKIVEAPKAFTQEKVVNPNKPTENLPKEKQQ
ncbi:Vancomycin resistance protein YoaR, contains peptidoglycan-binding and VanW domains [Seinonella peptonophila]|uniref:Vancomycin resistance protein YoaR, contains peptidoglycan-binding and VanW domains n=1 Tax=Seinonella peptonophila TaxID=112248 RepID=A0A1M4ZJ89_9BACL|nr:VanW family protein [Seinonella peptonophila]SHF17616.1 Vancomycin resistance protein YoaR, contains peptidoglycan-binding and VanW domains [Seinonella peptonophila]